MMDEYGHDYGPSPIRRWWGAWYELQALRRLRMEPTPPARVQALPLVWIAHYDEPPAAVTDEVWQRLRHGLLLPASRDAGEE